jgi:hypothetical protein
MRALFGLVTSRGVREATIGDLRYWPVARLPTTSTCWGGALAVDVRSAGEVLVTLSCEFHLKPVAGA